jgi:hypothetical protein
MITGILICFIFFAAMSDNVSGEDRTAFIIFTSLSAMFQIVGDAIPDSSGVWYYVGASLTMLMIMIMLSNIQGLTRKIIKIQFICMLFINANLIGLALYYLYISPIYYNVACYFLFIAVLWQAGLYREIYGRVKNMARHCYNLYNAFKCSIFVASNKKKA